MEVLPIRTKGFTLPEVIVGVALLGLMTVGALVIVGMTNRIILPRWVKVDGELLPVAPSASAFADAVSLHGVFLDQLASAKAVYVFGGIHTDIPVSAPQRLVLPLSAGALPVISDFSSGLPLDAYTFYKRYQTSLGGFETGGSSEDYTVIVIAPVRARSRLEVTGLAQVRRANKLLSDGIASESYVRREVKLYDHDGNTWSYVYLEKPEAAATANVGATHHWYRYDAGRVAEGGPVVATFPDPWLYAGVRNGPTADVQPFSRFLYLLPISR